MPRNSSATLVESELDTSRIESVRSNPSPAATLISTDTDLIERQRYSQRTRGADSAFFDVPSPQTPERSREEIVAETFREAQRDINRLAAQNVTQAFDPETTRTQVQADIQELQSKYGSKLSQAEIQTLIDRYSEERNKLREQAMWRELRSAARNQARVDFDCDPADGLSARDARADLQRVAEKYADVQNLSSLQDEMVEYYQTSYESRHEYLFQNELGYWQRKWYGARRWISNITNSIGNFLSSVKDGVVNVAKGIYEVGKAVVKMAADTSQAVINTVKKTVDYVTDPENLQKAWDSVCSVASSIKNIAVSTYEFLSDPEKVWETLTTAANWIRSGLEATYNFLTDPATRQAIIDGLGAAYNFITDRETWYAMGRGIQAAYEYCTDPENIQAAITFVGNCLNDPIGTAKAAWKATAGVREFLMDMSNAMGLTDIVVGVWNLAKVPFEQIKGVINTGGQLISDFAKLATGQITATELRENFEHNINEAVNKVSNCINEGLRAIKGGILLAGELTGITDCVLTIKYALEGNWAMAGMHAGFACLSIGALTATIATGGAAAGSMVAVALGRTTLKAAGKSILKTTAKNFFKEASAGLGKEAIQQMEKRIGKENLEVMCKEGAETISVEGSKRLANAVNKEGAQALNKEATQSIMREGSEAVTDRILKEADLTNIVDELTHELLENVQKMSNRELRDLLVRKGVANSDEAMKVAKQIRNHVKNGKADDAIKQILEDGISAEVRAYVENHMEQAFKSHFRKVLLGELSDEYSQTLAKACRENAGRLGKDLDEYIDEIVEAGWKGVKEGIEKSVRKAVREGIERAFKRFRKGKPLRLRPRVALSEQSHTSEMAETEISTREQSESEHTYHSEEHQESQREQLHGPLPTGMKHEIVVVDGVPMLVLYTLGDDNEWHQVEMQRM